MMQSGIRWLGGSLLGTAIILLTAGTASAQVGEHQFRLGSVIPNMEHNAGVTAQSFKDELVRLSDGNMDAEIFIGGLLGDSVSMQEQVSRGVLDLYIGFISTSLDPRLDLINVPGLFWTWEDAQAFWQQPDSELLAAFNEIAEEVGWKVLGTIPCCFNTVIADVEFTPVPSEVEQLNLRSRSMAMTSDVLAVGAIGFNAIPMPFQETATAMATGMIDAVAGPGMSDIPTFEGLADYVYTYHYRAEVSPLIMSAEVWNGLTPEEQEIVQQAATAATGPGWERIRTITEEYIDRADEWGIQVVELTEEQNIENIRVIREEVWPQLEESLGADVMEQVRALSVPLPQ